MKVLAFANNKGGVGKTSSVQNVGVYLAQQGYRVLLIDSDPQGSLTRSFGISLSSVEATVYELALQTKPIEEIILTSDLLHLIPARSDLNKRAFVLQSEKFHEFKMQKALKVLDYDYCLIDCPPSLDVYTTMSLVACHYYFVPLQAEFLAYEGLANFIHFINREINQVAEGCQLGGVFPTRYNPAIRGQLRSQMIALAQQSLGEYYMQDYYIRENIAISEAQALGKSVLEHKPDSHGAHDYRRLSTAILERVV